MSNVSKERHAYLAGQYSLALQGKPSIFANKGYSAKKMAFLADQHRKASKGQPTRLTAAANQVRTAA